MNSLSMLDKLQSAVIHDTVKEEKISVKKNTFDKLKMYFCYDYVINGITISQPTIGDILDIGENEFYHSLSPFLYNSTSIRLLLWENKIDWNEVTDIEVFSFLMPIVKKEPLKLLFKDISFDDFQLINVKKNHDEEFKKAIYSESQDILIYEDEYIIIAEYIREMFNIHPKVEKAKGKTAKKWIIQNDKMNLQNKKDENTSTLLPLVSACVNHPGFKYNVKELKEIGIYQFMDSVKRIQKYEEATAALKGIFSGFVSTKDIGKETLNFMGDI